MMGKRPNPALLPTLSLDLKNTITFTNDSTTEIDVNFHLFLHNKYSVLTQIDLVLSLLVN